jgi:hypothetical protein
VCSDADKDKKMYLVENRGKEDPFDKGENQPEDKWNDWMQAPHQQHADAGHQRGDAHDCHNRHTCMNTEPAC